MFLLSNDYWEVRTTEKKGRGLFAKKDILPGVVIGDYLGRVVRTFEACDMDDPKNFYLLYYHDQASIYPDLTHPGMHLLNHACLPNCWMYTYQGHTLFFSLRRIFAGEELTIHYLLSSQTCRSCPHICTCDSVICYHTMHLSEKRYDAWSTFHEKQASQTKRKRITYGKQLAKLSSYPVTIPDNPIYPLFGINEKPPVTYTEKKLPSLQRIRELIRETGRTLYFSEFNMCIPGVLEDTIISQSLV